MSRRMRKQSAQRGAATVESAIIIVVFLMLVMGIIEFALLIFNASSLVEATRAGARYLIVNDPVATLGSDTCDTPVTVDCSGGTCDEVLSVMQRFYAPLEAGNLEISYRCSSTGYGEAFFDIYEVELRLVGVQYEFITPGILGLDSTVTLPEFKTTRLSEDMETVPAAGG